MHLYFPAMRLYIFPQFTIYDLQLHNSSSLVQKYYLKISVFT